jgi:hypothetical protein
MGAGLVVTEIVVGQQRGTGIGYVFKSHPSGGMLFNNPFKICTEFFLLGDDDHLSGCIDVFIFKVISEADGADNDTGILGEVLIKSGGHFFIGDIHFLQDGVIFFALKRIKLVGEPDGGIKVNKKQQNGGDNHTPAGGMMRKI